jgi:hypothetical protein
MRFSFTVLSFALFLFPACGGDNTNSDPPQPILAVNGTISAAGRGVVPTYGVAAVKKTGTHGIIVSDASIGCAAVDAEYTSRNMPAPGTYMSVAVPSFDRGVTERAFVYFIVISEHGSDLSGGGSNAGTVEVVDSTDTTVTVRIDYHATLSDGDYAVSGDFTVTRCP